MQQHPVKVYECVIKFGAHPYVFDHLIVKVRIFRELFAVEILVQAYCYVRGTVARVDIRLALSS